MPAESLFENRSVFVSSTFRDMQGERDLIRDVVLTELADYAEKRSVDIEFVDLRWGVSTSGMDSEDSKEKLILKVCLDTIDETRPFMIVLLGDRYGWTPESSLLEAAAKEKNFTIENAKSVTALEIEYALLGNRDLMRHCFFYFRDALPYHEMDENTRRLYNDVYDNPDSIRLLSDLKDELKNKFPEKVRYYSATWNNRTGKIVSFGGLDKLIYADLKNALDYELSLRPPVSVSQRRLYEVEMFFDKRKKGFCGRKKELSVLNDFALNQSGIMILSGESGMGKSAILSMMYDILKQHDTVFVLPFSCGLSSELSSSMDLLALWIELLSDYYLAKSGKQVYDKTENYSFNDLVNMLEQLLFECSEYTKIVLLLDAINQFGAGLREQKLGYIPVALPDSLSLIVSITSTCPQKEELLARGAAIVELGLLNELEIGQIIQTGFAQRYKTVSDSVIETIVRKPNAGSPIVLSAIMQTLLSVDEDDFNEAYAAYSGIKQDVLIDRLLIDVVNSIPDKLEMIYPHLLKKLSKRVQPQMLEMMLGLIVNSQFGLRVSDIETVCRQQSISFSTADFYYILKRFKHQFIQNSNQAWNFHHQLVKNSIKNHTGEKKYLTLLADLFADIDVNDTFALSSALYHLALCNRVADTERLIHKVIGHKPEHLGFVVESAILLLTNEHSEEFGYRMLAGIYGSQDFESEQKTLLFYTALLRLAMEQLPKEKLQLLLTLLDNVFKIDRFTRIIDIRVAQYLAVRSEIIALSGNWNMAMNMSEFAVHQGEKVFDKNYFPIVYKQPMNKQFGMVYPSICSKRLDYLKDIAEITIDDHENWDDYLAGMRNMLLDIDGIIMTHAEICAQMIHKGLLNKTIDYYMEKLRSYDYSFFSPQSRNGRDEATRKKVMHYRLGLCCSIIAILYSTGNEKNAQDTFGVVSRWDEMKNDSDIFDRKTLGTFYLYGAKSNRQMNDDAIADESYRKATGHFLALYRDESQMRYLHLYLDAGLDYASFLTEKGKNEDLSKLSVSLRSYLLLLEKRYSIDSKSREILSKAKQFIHK